jgi:hypothetical protein
MVAAVNEDVVDAIAETGFRNGASASVSVDAVEQSLAALEIPERAACQRAPESASEGVAFEKDLAFRERGIIEVQVVVTRIEAGLVVHGDNRARAGVAA